MLSLEGAQKIAIFGYRTHVICAVSVTFFHIGVPPAFLVVRLLHELSRQREQFTREANRKNR
jgi:hypothetical protein